MNFAKIIFVLFTMLLPGNRLLSQVYIQPNVGLKSHKTLEILKIESTSQNTVIYFSIENRITGGGCHKWGTARSQKRNPGKLCQTSGKT